MEISLQLTILEEFKYWLYWVSIDIKASLRIKIKLIENQLMNIKILVGYNTS